MPKRAPATYRRPSFLLRLENFRAFQDSGSFRVAPLTFLVGRNSGGKSSVISSLLLLKQSLEREMMGATITPLSLSGPYCDLGNYSDVVHNHDESAEISLTLEASLKDISDDQSPHAHGLMPFVDLRLPRAVRPFGYGVPFFGMDRTPSLPTSGNITARLTFAMDEPYGPSLSRIEIELENVARVKFVRTISGAKKQHWRTYTSDLPPRSLWLRHSPRSFFPIITIHERSFRSSGSRARSKIRSFTLASQMFFSFIHRMLLRSDVIGPFRTPPERRYSFGGFTSARSGPSGDKAVDLLITESLLTPKLQAGLLNATSFWLKHLKLAENLDVLDIAKRLNLFQVNVSGAGVVKSTLDSNLAANFADVGFGLSQVLLVLVQGMLMRPGGIYFVQQPEIHLHPDAQAGLADFFIYLSTYGVTTVVETHSEYLLLRLRRRLAEAAGPVSVGLSVEGVSLPALTKSDVAVLLTEPSDGGGGATIRELEIGDSFQFENLPHGFMSQAIDDRMALLQAVAKKG